MAKKKSKNKKIVNNISSGTDTKNVVKVIVVVLIVFFLVYLLTIYITSNSTDEVVKKQIENTTIQYDEILAGTSFDQKDNEYLVLFYNVDEDENSTYYTLKSDYEAKDDSHPIYYVDLGNSMNKGCVATEDNPYATSVEELKISQPTLIKISNHKVEDYLIGENQIKNYLN